MCLLFGLKLVHLLDVYGETTGCVETARTEVTFEVFSLLVLHENWG
jgi:hypothetical protein